MRALTQQRTTQGRSTQNAKRDSPRVWSAGSIDVQRPRADEDGFSTDPDRAQLAPDEIYLQVQPARTSHLDALIDGPPQRSVARLGPESEKPRERGTRSSGRRIFSNTESRREHPRADVAALEDSAPLLGAEHEHLARPVSAKDFFPFERIDLLPGQHLGLDEWNE